MPVPHRIRLLSVHGAEERAEPGGLLGGVGWKGEGLEGGGGRGSGGEGGGGIWVFLQFETYRFYKPHRVNNMIITMILT